VGSCCVRPIWSPFLDCPVVACLNRILPATSPRATHAHSRHSHACSEDKRKAEAQRLHRAAEESDHRAQVHTCRWWLAIACAACPSALHPDCGRRWRNLCISGFCHRCLLCMTDLLYPRLAGAERPSDATHGPARVAAGSCLISLFVFLLSRVQSLFALPPWQSVRHQTFLRPLFPVSIPLSLFLAAPLLTLHSRPPRLMRAQRKKTEETSELKDENRRLQVRSSRC
jgi:hypothetical protein